MNAGRGIIERLNREINALESLRGFILWTRAPAKVADAVQNALDALNEGARIAENWIERNQENLTMKEFFEMLGKFKTAQDAIKGTSERLDKMNDVCGKFNDGFDRFAEAAAGFDGLFDSFADAEGEAAPNGEIGEATETTETTETPLETL